jgi:hypothetical protein
MLASLPERKIQPIIVTTKESRFVSQLLKEQGVELASEFIWGKELKRSKTDSLKLILDRGGKKPPNVWFVEDKLSTLAKIASQPELEAVKLYLADWGYNTDAEREAVLQQSRIQLLTLADFPTLGGEAKKTAVSKAIAPVEVA